MPDCLTLGGQSYTNYIKEVRVRLVKLKSKKVKKLPAYVPLPKLFVRACDLQMDDVLDIYLSETGELIIKKRGAK